MDMVCADGRGETRQPSGTARAKHGVLPAWVYHDWCSGLEWEQLSHPERYSR